MLNDAKVRAAKPREKAYKLTDSNRLFLLVTPSGGKLWRWNYSYDGKQKSMSSGIYPMVALVTAREKRDDALREPGFGECLDDERMGARAQFAGLEDHAVAAGERDGDRSHTQNDRGIPGRNARDHPHWLLQRHGEAARITSPAICVVRAAASRTMPVASIRLNMAQPAVEPVSAIIAATKSFLRAASASAAFISTARRALGPCAAQVGNAVAARGDRRHVAGLQGGCGRGQFACNRIDAVEFHAALQDQRLTGRK